MCACSCVHMLKFKLPMRGGGVLAWGHDDTSHAPRPSHETLRGASPLLTLQTRAWRRHRRWMCRRRHRRRCDVLAAASTLSRPCIAGAQGWGRQPPTPRLLRRPAAVRHHLWTWLRCGASLRWWGRRCWRVGQGRDPQQNPASASRRRRDDARAGRWQRCQWARATCAPPGEPEGGRCWASLRHSLRVPQGLGSSRP